MGEEPNEIEGAGEGGARVSSDEAEVRIRESALPRTEEERAPAVCELRPRQLVCEPEETAAGGVGSVHLRLGQTRSEWRPDGGTNEVPESESRAGAEFPSFDIAPFRNSAYSECP